MNIEKYQEINLIKQQLHSIPECSLLYAHYFHPERWIISVGFLNMRENISNVSYIMYGHGYTLKHTEDVVGKDKHVDRKVLYFSK